MKLKMVLIQAENGVELELTDMTIASLGDLDAFLNGTVSGKIRVKGITAPTDRMAEILETLPKPNPSKPGMKKDRGTTLAIMQFMALNPEPKRLSEIESYLERKGFRGRSASGCIHQARQRGYMTMQQRGGAPAQYKLTDKGRQRAQDPRLNAKGELRPVVHVKVGEGVIENGGKK